jgi:hypothetical protein
MPAEEAAARLYTRETGLEELRLHAELVAHQQAMQGGDEFSLVQKSSDGRRPTVRVPRPRSTRATLSAESPRPLTGRVTKRFRAVVSAMARAQKRGNPLQ